MNEKRCGTCRWWDSWALKGRPQSERGSCEYEPVLPDCFEGPTDSRYSMKENQGKDCPCWQTKEKRE